MHTSQASICPSVPHRSSKTGVVEKIVNITKKNPVTYKTPRNDFYILKITHRIPEKQNSTIVQENRDLAWLLFAWRITEVDFTSVRNVTSGKQKTDMTDELSPHTVPAIQSQQVVADSYLTFITKGRLRTTMYLTYTEKRKPTLHCQPPTKKNCSFFTKS